jgi:hypothetical protein
MSQPKPALKQFIRAKNGQPIGLIVAIKDGDSFRIGWSLTAVKKGDKFNKHLGERIAISRAMSSTPTTFPDAVYRTYYPKGKRSFTDRCKAYFKV